LGLKRLDAREIELQGDRMASKRFRFEVAAEKEEDRRKEFTPLVARTVLWATALAAMVLALVAR